MRFVGSADTKVKEEELQGSDGADQVLKSKLVYFRFDRIVSLLNVKENLNENSNWGRKNDGNS